MKSKKTTPENRTNGGMLVACAVLTVLIFSLALALLWLHAHKEPVAHREAAMREMARQSVLLTTPDPNSVRILSFSEVDSVFGRRFIRADEFSEVLENLMAFNQELSTDNPTALSDDPALMERIRRGISVSDILDQTEDPEREPNGPFSGWRLKVTYSCAGEYNDSLVNVRYVIFDKQRTCILHSLDIPVL